MNVSHSFLVRFPRSNVRIQSIACGTSHSVAIDSRGVAWAWGAGAHGQIGCGSKVSYQAEPVRMIIDFEASQQSSGSRLSVSTPEQVRLREVACGDSHTVLLCKRGRVWVCGSNSHGQLGLSVVSKDVLSLTHLHVPHGENMVSVKCGNTHTVALSEAGRVYTWGSGMYGQLGHGNRDDQSTPTMVQSLSGKRIRAIACGAVHTIALTDLENLYSWGRGSHGRLGHGDIDDQLLPRLVDFLMGKSVVLVAAGFSHTLAVTSDALGVSSWGCGEQGQLGHGDCDSKLLPTPVAALNKTRITAIACGESFSAALTEEEQVCVWGSNDQGQLGLLQLEPDVTAQPPCSPRPLFLTFPPPSAMERAPQLVVRLSGPPQPTAPSAATRFLSSGLPFAERVDENFFDASGGLAVPLEELQPRLEALLTARFLSYRPVFLAQAAVAVRQFDCAALIYELLQEPLRGFAYRLLAIKETCQRQAEADLVELSFVALQTAMEARHISLSSGSSRSSSSTGSGGGSSSTTTSVGTSATTTSGMNSGSISLNHNSSGTHNSTLANQAALLSQFLVFVAGQDVSPSTVQQIEQRLILQMTLYGPPLLVLLDNNSSSERPWLLHFSSRLYLAACNYRVVTLNLEKGRQMPVAKDKLWSEVRDNLARHLDTSSRKRSHVCIPSISLRGYQKYATDKDSQVMVFSCEHTFPRAAFLKTVLPEYQDRFGSKDGMEVLSTLIQADYRLPFVNLACPNCIQQLD